MKYAPLDTVVLVRDLPDHGLCAGDLGAVVEVYDSNGLEGCVPGSVEKFWRNLC